MRELGVIDDGAVLIVDGLIHDVGPSRRVENLAAARKAEEVSADGRVVMPGFVDCRTHLVTGPPLFNDYEMRLQGAGESEIQSAGGGLRALQQALRASTRPRLEMLARQALREFIRHGTTTLEGRSGLGLDDKTELKILRALNRVQSRPLDLLVTFFGAAMFPDEFDGGPGGFIDHLITNTLPKIKRARLASFVDVCVGADGFSAGQARRYLLAAQQLGFIPRLTTGRRGSSSGIALAVELGVPSVDRVESATTDDAGLLARSSTIATLLPGEAFQRLEDRYAPARELIDAGAAVALASGFSSDGCASCSMPAILSLACNQMRMSPAEAITGATINAAHALCCGGHIGSLECGKDADLIMLNASDYRQIPYHFGLNLVAMMMKRGDVVYPRMEFPWSKS
jgi:imidazolonepropionase